MEETKKALQDEINRLQDEISQNETLLAGNIGTEMTILVEEEIAKLKNTVKDLNNSLNALEGNFEINSDEDSNEDFSLNIAILEIRAGTGGDEAGLFAKDLYDMYLRYAEKANWKKELLFLSENEAGGIKTVSLKLKGLNAYMLLKNESGVHRVQRVPKTEASGRIHTSAATVAVLPELKKVKINLRPEDIKIDFFRSGGSGGQNVNKVSTAVRLTHVPTNTVVECQEERTQGKNREKAMQMLESRIYTMMKEQKVKEISDLRAEQVGLGDRSEKIRTYNFPQDRVTDHRINRNWHNLPAIMNGDIQTILEEVSRIT